MFANVCNVCECNASEFNAALHSNFVIGKVITANVEGRSIKPIDSQNCSTRNFIKVSFIQLNPL